MEYHIVVDPKLELNIPDLMATWNDTPECRTVAKASRATQPLRDYPGIPIILTPGVSARQVQRVIPDLLKKALTRLTTPDIYERIQIKAVSQTEYHLVISG